MKFSDSRLIEYRIYSNRIRPEYRPPRLEAALSLKIESILKARAYRISSDIGLEIAMEKSYKPRPAFEEIRHTNINRILPKFRSIGHY